MEYRFSAYPLLPIMWGWSVESFQEVRRHDSHSGSSTVATLCEIGDQIHSGKMDRVDKELLEETVKTLYKANVR